MRPMIGIAAVATIVTGLSGAAQGNMLTNPGFESDFAGWNATVGDPAPAMNVWRISTWPGDQRTAESTRAAVLDVKSTVDTLGGSYWNLLAQVAPVTGGQSYQVSGWEKTAGMAGHSESWIEVQFLASDNSILQQYQSAHVTADQAYTLMNVTNSGNSELLAPVNATAIRVQAVVQQTSAEPIGNTEYHVFDDFNLSPIPEPGVGLLIGSVGAACLMRRRRASSRAAARRTWEKDD